MKLNRPVFFLMAGSLFIMMSCSQQDLHTIQTSGPEVIDFRALPFDLDQVTLLDGPFKHATDLNIQSLLNYEPDRLLAKFRMEAGLEPKAEHYHGWEDETISGHGLGHYLSACALMYQTSGNKEFLDRLNYIVDELEICQEADGDGFIGAFPDGKRVLEEEVARGDIRSKGFDLNGIWVPWYNEHKTMAGLRDAYRLCGNNKALEVEKKLARWIGTIVGDLNDEQIQEMLHCEHGGMNEVLADLYADTGEEYYLQLSRVFHHKAILDPLAEQIDILPGKHGNTQIPKFIGVARRYELTNDPVDRTIAEFAWERIVNHHSYVTGGHGNHEYFGPADSLRNRLSDGTTETCNVYNMLKLSRHLFEWDASARVADYYERALFNHILSSQHPADGRVIYNLSLEMGGQKTYQDPFWFTCCVGTGMENHSKYGWNIFFHNDQELFVSQFIAAELHWHEKGVTVRQATQFPMEQGTAIEFDCEKAIPLTLQVRYPYWAKNGIEIFVNGKEVKIDEAPSSFIPIRRKWKTGDQVEVRFPFNLRLETMPDDSNRVAILYGPLVMAGDLGPENDPGISDPMYVPILMTGERNPSAWLKSSGTQSNAFMTSDVGQPRDVPINPFYTTHERRYTIYWDMFTEERWKRFQAEYEARIAERKKIEEMTYDHVRPGEMQPERDHNFQGENTNPGEFKNRHYRLSRNGWFSYDMDVMMGQPMALAVEYWGGYPGSRTFDILVDGQVVATENIANKKDGQFLYILYDIPEDLTYGKRRVTVMFRSHEGHRAGPVFGIRMIKR